MNILVTGATGFIGKHLCARLKAAGHDVIELGSRDTLPVWGKVRIDQIWHLAAWTQAGTFCLEHPAEQWLINQRINLEIMEFWSKRPQTKFISIGTSCAYDPYVPMEEPEYLEGKPIPDLMAYAMSKRMLQIGVEAMAKQYGMKWLTLVPATVYGPGYQWNDGRQPHFIYDLARKILEAKRTGISAVLWGDGMQVRELVHVDDFLRIGMSLAEDSFGLFNVGTGEPHSIKEFAGIICEIIDCDPALVTYDLTGYQGARGKHLRVKKLKDYRKYLSFVPLREGIAQVMREMGA